MPHVLGLGVVRQVVVFVDEALEAVFGRLHEAGDPEDVLAALDQPPHLDLPVVVLDELLVGIQQRLEQLDRLLQQHFRRLEVDQSFVVQLDQRHPHDLPGLASLHHHEARRVSRVDDLGHQLLFELFVGLEDARAVEVGVLVIWAYDETGDFSVLQDVFEDPARESVGRVVDEEDQRVLVLDLESRQVLFQVVPGEVDKESFLVDGFGGLLYELIASRGGNH